MHRKSARSVAARVLLLILIGALFCGCAAKPEKKRPPAVRTELTKRELLNLLENNNKELRSLKSKIKVKVRTPVTRGDQYLEEGFLRIEKPQKLRLLAKKPLAAKLEIVINGATFWVHLKVFGDEELYTGKVDEPVRESDVPISPAMLIEAMGLSEVIITGEERCRLEDYYEEYVIAVHRKRDRQLVKKIYISAYDLTISRIDYFSPDGKIFAVVSLRDYTREGEFSIPATVEARWPFNQSFLRIRLKRIEVNEQLPEKLWKFKPPEGLDPVVIGASER